MQISDVWQYRELLYFLVWRDLKIRYKQTALGVAWIIIQPLVSMAIFSFLFGGLLNVPHEGIPYPLFAFAALLPWNYFANTLAKSSTSLVSNANLISKVFFPCLLLPLSCILSGLVDFAVSFVILLFFLLFYNVALTWIVLILPLFLILAILISLGFSLWFSSLNVRFRDVNYMIPFIIQIWMYITPVIYGATLIPENYRFFFNLNPMTGVVEGFRWALLSGTTQAALEMGSLFIASIAITFVVLISGLIFFHSTERTFADYI